MNGALLLGRLLFGAWMLANGINHFFFRCGPSRPARSPSPRS